MTQLNSDRFWGIDCGSTEIKVVLCDSTGKVLEMRKARTLFPIAEHVKRLLRDGPETPFEDSGKIKKSHKLKITGYGRNHVDFIADRLTEIKAHFLGVNKLMGLKGGYSIIDIGGQDSKVIQILDSEVSDFVINRKCAAGTGAYIESLAHRLEIPLEDLPKLERAHDKDIVLNSFCTVFAGQEVIKVLMEGEKVENLIHALYRSVVKRVLEMGQIKTSKVIFTGGVVSYHPALVTLFGEKLSGKDLSVAPHSQFCGAIGAASFLDSGAAP